jgi:arabinan endo-1,5-alpha-L-arabinosidase
MYYCASQPLNPKSAIGVATSPTAEPGSWTDHGMVIDSDGSQGYNALDPNLLVDSGGRWWLTFGSHWAGLQVVELDPADGKLKAGATPLNIAQRPHPAGQPGPTIEAGFQFRHEAYYYLFASFDNCCNVKEPITYKVRVGRSSSPTGPFLDRNGVDMRSGGGTIVLEGHGNVEAAGGQSIVHDPLDDSDLIVYHWYDKRLPASSEPEVSSSTRAFLGINRLGWDAAGWPYLY